MSDIYRYTNLGKALQVALDEFESELSSAQRQELLARFDAHLNAKLGKLERHASFRVRPQDAAHTSYKYFDDVWTFMLRNVEFSVDKAEQAGGRKALTIVAQKAFLKDPEKPPELQEGGPAAAAVQVKTEPAPPPRPPPGPPL